jgi:prenyltransferase beta subunit
MEDRKQRSCSPFSNFPFPIVQYAFCKLWACLLLLTLSFYATTGMAAKSPYDTIEQATSYILKHQNDDGGWPLIPGGESDVEVTAFAMQALMLKGWGSGSSVIRQGVSFLIKNQRSDGSWNGNAAHTIFAAIALKRAEAVEYWEAQFNALKWLEEAQREGGSWSREVRQPGNPLYTGAVLTGLGLLDFDRESELVTKAADWLAHRTLFSIELTFQSELDKNSVSVALQREFAENGAALLNPATIMIEEKGRRWLIADARGEYLIKKQGEALNICVSRINYDGGWSMVYGERSDVLVTSWVLQGLSIAYDVSLQMVWLKQMQNDDGGFGRWEGAPSDPEITAYAVLALVIGEDPLNADQVALRYLREVQQEDGSFVSATPIELKEPTANLQTTCFVLWAIYAEKLKGK